MNVISHQHQYGNNKDLMKRLADASQYKIYPSIIPRNELSLRKILLTTRLWNHVRRQQAMMTIPSDDWLFQQQSAITQENTKEQDSIPTNDDNQSEHDWSWFNKETKSSPFLDSLSHEEDKSTSRKRTRNEEEEEEKQEQVQIKKIKLHFNTIDPPAAPAGPDIADTTHATSPPSPPSPAVLLSA